MRIYALNFGLRVVGARQHYQRKVSRECHFQPTLGTREEMRKLASSSSPAGGLDGLEGGGLLWEGARRGGMLV
jgi:hypothetical protein